MAETALADSGFLVALLRARDRDHQWAVAQTPRVPPPWRTCEAALSEAFHLLGSFGASELTGLLRLRGVLVSFEFGPEQDAVLTLMQKYSDVPMSLADACLVRMSEIFPEPIVLTTDSDFRLYRRHSRQVIPCVMPS
jgi:uncharacterized protein